jgi:hypothetical protein
MTLGCARMSLFRSQAPVPQLDRGPAYEAVSCAFESRRAHTRHHDRVVLFALS